MYCSLILLAALAAGPEVIVATGEHHQATADIRAQQPELDQEWLTYSNYDSHRFVTWGFPERATKVDPSDFGLTHPFQVTKVNAMFYRTGLLPWRDTTFFFKIYADDGQTMLYQSGPIEAVPGQPGPPVVHNFFQSGVTIRSGEFYVAIAPVSDSGRPSNAADGTPDGRSFYGEPGNWRRRTEGEHCVGFMVCEYAGGLLVPEGGEYWVGGDTYTIMWTVDPSKDYDYSRLLLSTDGGSTFPTTIAAALPSPETTYLWGVPELNTDECRVKLQVYDTLGTLALVSTSSVDFTIDSEAPGAPSQLEPPDGSALNYTGIVFRWRGVADLSGVDYYTLQIAYDSGFTALVDTARLADTVYQRSLPSDTAYYWRARATDRSGQVSAWSPTWRFEIDLYVPETPVLLEPVGGLWLESTTVPFRWTPVVFSKGGEAGFSPVAYILQLDTIRGIRPLLTDTTAVPYDTVSFLFGSRYWWRVRAYDLAGNQGEFSPLDSFGIDISPPQIPRLIYPPHLGGVDTDTTSLVWHVSGDNLSGTEFYHVQVARDSLFTDTIPVPSPVTPDTAEVCSLPGAADYYWHIRAVDRAGNWSRWSPRRMFSRYVGLAGQEGTLLFSLAPAGPQPATRRARFTLSLPRTERVEARVYDAAGKEVAILAAGILAAGRHELQWDVRSASSGVYCLLIRTPDRSAATRFLVVK